LLTVRNIYASPVLNVHSEEWYAPSYQQCMHAYDMTAIEAMPQMEEVPDDQAVSWMENLIKKAAATEPDALQKTLFELQSVDWRKAKKGENRAIATEVLAAQMRMLSAHGALNFGYYPDDFHANIPNAAVLSKDFAVTP
jgi:biofilm PGA synthesis lipoprotein PgaB